MKSFFKNINNWQDFTDKLSNLNNKEKGDAFELLTKCYFKIKPQYNHYDDVWLLDEVPQKELDYLKIPSHDIGIDLIAKEGKEYYAIQCKYHSDENKNVNLKEVSTFLSQVAANKRISMGYICSTGMDTSKNYQKSHKKEIQEILVDSWQLLDKGFFDNVRRLLSDKKVKEKPYKPRKHQKKAIKEAKKHFVKEGNDRGKLIFPCGAGKSLTGYWLTEVLDSKSTLIAVPSLSLVKQTLEVYLREIVANGIKVKWLCICSDEGIGTSDDVAIMTNNIGVPCKTDPAYIKDWLKTNKNEHKIVFTTYQSGHLIADISKKLKISFDVGIFDEAHKTVGSKLKRFSHLLFEENISIKKRIFMTATERFYSGSKDDIISMDDDDVYGETFSYMTFKEAIESDLLTDYKIITIDIKKSEISDFIKENNLVQLNGKWKKETEARSLASMLALRKAMKSFDIKNVVSFHSSIDKAKRNKELQQYITDTYNYKPIDTYTVSGKIPTTKRNVIVQEFAKSDRALITNARCLTEGIDVPNIDCIVFADPRKSKVDIVQALGRALRKKDGKEWGYVILPVVYDGDTNEIDNDNFNEIISIVRGLAANDERIIEYFKDKGKKGKGSGDIIKGSDVFSVDSSMLEEKDLIGHLQIKLWEKLSKFQWSPFEEVREHVRSLGLKSQKEYVEYIQSINNQELGIPSKPRRVYKDKGWKGMGDFLGTGTIAPHLREYKPFVEARAFVRGLGLKNESQWVDFCNSSNFPSDIPRTPSVVYKDEGYVSIGDWLGTGRVATQKLKDIYISFEEAKEFVREKGIKSSTQYNLFVKSKDYFKEMPRNPPVGYKDKWISWGDFLGTGRVQDNKLVKRTYEEAKEYLKPLGIIGSAGWKEYCKSGNKPQNIPSNAKKYYGKEWKGYTDFLSHEVISRRHKYRPFIEAREFARSLGLKSWSEWTDYYQNNELPDDIPKIPKNAYQDEGYISIGDWLGTGRIADHLKEYRKFDNARKYARKLKLKSYSEWKLYCKSGDKPKDIPSGPDGVYKNKGWVNWGDFLGTGTIASFNRKYETYENARDFARKLNLPSKSSWEEYCKLDLKPKSIPTSVSIVYKDKGWISWGDFLGTNNIKGFPIKFPKTPASVYKDKGWKGWGDFLDTKEATYNREYKTFKQARNFVRKLKLKSTAEWYKYSKSNQIPDDIPASPDGIYKEKGWISWGDFLGNNFIATQNRNYKSFNEARKYARKLGLKTQREWYDFAKSDKLPKDMPANPNQVYKHKGWINIGDFLGTGNIAPRLRVYKSFKEARKYARSLNLKSGKEWSEYCKSNNIPKDIPRSPINQYRNKGWISMGDWLGTGIIAAHLRQYKSFNKARKYVQSLDIKTQKEWFVFTKTGNLPKDIPANPNNVFKDNGWISWGDWLGTGKTATTKRKYKSFIEARKYARSLNLKSGKEWSELRKEGKLPVDISGSPRKTYKDKGWVSMGDWLGTGRIADHLKEFRDFKSARKYVQTLKLKNLKEWMSFSKSGDKPDDIPSTPARVYKNKGWTNLGDWLGTGYVAPFKREYLSYIDAKKQIKKFGLKNWSDWKKFVKSGKKPSNIPSNVSTIYKDKGWVSMKDFLGND